ncbi:MAG: glycosyl hydrolase [Candidatus Cloacimonetes bacterium]|nr:glycosyl hydrolase [Candidatus Cloacimonadota bacterium]
MSERKLLTQIYPIIILILFLNLYALWGDATNTYYGIYSTTEILLTSSAGEKLALQENVVFTKGKAEGTIVLVYPEILKQTIEGIGTSFTESSAFVLAHLDKQKRRNVMENIYSVKGANFSLARTVIGSCDFSVKGKYSYADVPDDTLLESFDIAPDKEGFDRAEFPGIKDESYDLLPMIKEALAIKNQQSDKELRIISSAWTAPAWMKDIETWYIPGSPENNWQGTGGTLKEQYVSIYADYLLKYLDASKDEGVNIWGLTPVNEPHGNNGQWESMSFTPKSQNDFIKYHLGPRLKSSVHSDVKLLIYDQNRDGLEHWADTIYNDPETTPYLYGAAVHWYASTYKVYEDVFDRVHEKYPDFVILHTEGCIDDLGKDAPDGVTDPDGYKESNWFDNDEFWWSKSATDWAYSVTWEGVIADDHPMYTPVHRYARNIIVSINHWLTGWIDWNIVLDRNGGPNHVGNFCGAPIMIDTETQYVYYTPVYYILSQFSRTIRPGDRAVQTDIISGGLEEDDLHACSTLNEAGLLSVQILNTSSKPIKYKLQIGYDHANIEIPANSVQTVRVQLPKV